jgi:hypothetical protein
MLAAYARLSVSCLKYLQARPSSLLPNPGLAPASIGRWPVQIEYNPSNPGLPQRDFRWTKTIRNDIGRISTFWGFVG